MSLRCDYTGESAGALKLVVCCLARCQPKIIIVIHSVAELRSRWSCSRPSLCMTDYCCSSGGRIPVGGTGERAQTIPGMHIHMPVENTRKKEPFWYVAGGTREFTHTFVFRWFGCTSESRASKLEAASHIMIFFLPLTRKVVVVQQYKCRRRCSARCSPVSNVLRTPGLNSLTFRFVSKS